MHLRTSTRAGVTALVVGATVGIGVATAAAGPSGLHFSAALKVKITAAPSCHGGICLVHNHGTGRVTHFGAVTFTTTVIADTNQPPCGASSQWVNRITRTIHASQGTLVLHEAGLLCPDPGVGPRVDAVWAVDGADSTGTFAGATGHGTDIAYPAGDTAAPTGTITLAK